MAGVGVHRRVCSADRVELAWTLHFETLVHLRLTLLHIHLLHYLPVADPGTI